jgi:hypothetical protein
VIAPQPVSEQCPLPAGLETAGVTTADQVDGSGREDSPLQRITSDCGPDTP